MASISDQSDSIAPIKIKRLAKEINKQVASLGFSKKEDFSSLPKRFELNTQITRSITAISLASEKDLDAIIPSDINQIYDVFTEIFDEYGDRVSDFVMNLKQVYYCPAIGTKGG